jgi:hypothetical protein
MGHELPAAALVQITGYAVIGVADHRSGGGIQEDGG